MTTPAPTTTPPRGSGPAGGGAPASAAEGIDIKRVISGSTSEVTISELSKKGFTQVKVLNQGVITKLITEAVDQVIARRSQKIGRDERLKVIQESTTQFEALAKEKIKREQNRVTELEKANEALLRETEELRNRLKESEERAEKATASPGGSEELMQALLARLPAAAGVGALQESIQRIAAKLDRLPAGAGGGGEYVDKDVILDALFRDDGTKGAESNIDKIKVKETKAGGVKSTLAKLKALQKGGKDGD